MALGFAVCDSRAPECDDPGFALDQAVPTALGTGLFGSKSGGLFLEEFLDRSLGHGARGVLGDLLDVVGIELEVRADLLLDAPRHDFSPPLGHPTDTAR